MTRRTRNVSLKVNPDAEPRVVEQVGLYETISRPAREVPHPEPGETIIITDDPLPRVQEWLERIGRAIEAIRAEPKKYAKNSSEEVLRTNAWDCSVALTKLHTLFRELQDGSPLSIGTVALAIERGAELAEAWERLNVNACLEKPVKAHQNSSRAAKTNTADNNSRLQNAADNAALQSFRRWRDDLRRRAEMQRYSPAEQLQKYRKVVRPKKRLSDRLGRLLRAGKLT